MGRVIVCDYTSLSMVHNVHTTLLNHVCFAQNGLPKLTGCCTFDLGYAYLAEVEMQNRTLSYFTY